jgi:class 3 adenylate cyclase
LLSSVTSRNGGDGPSDDSLQRAAPNPAGEQ